jgi:hypothetical protein
MAQTPTHGGTQKSREKLAEEHLAAARELLEVNEDDGFEAHIERHPPNRWVIRVTLGTLSVRVRELSDGYFQIDGGGRDSGERWRAGTRDVNVAIAAAERYIESLRGNRGSAGLAAEIKALDPASGIDINMVERLFPYTDLASRGRARDYELAIRVVKHLFGGSTPESELTQGHLDAGVKERRKGIPRLNLKPCKPKTAVETFQRFATVLQHLKRADLGALLGVDDLRLIVTNPWSKAFGIKFPNKGRNKRRQPASETAYELLMAPFQYEQGGRSVTLPPPVDAVDPTGQLRLVLALAYYTGRRAGALLEVAVGQIVTDPHEMRDVLDRSEYGTPAWAGHFPCGLIDLVPEHDKESLHWPIPICRDLHLELALYRKRRGKRYGSGADPLIEYDYGRFVNSEEPKFRKDGKTLVSIHMGLYERALYTAAGYLEAAGREEDITSLPVRRRGVGWQHSPAYRTRDEQIVNGWREGLACPAAVRRWAIRTGEKLHVRRAAHTTLLERLGWSAARQLRSGTTLDTYAAYIAGWRMETGEARTDRYLGMDPRLLFACASFIKASEAMAVVEDDTAEVNEEVRRRARSWTEQQLEDR